jgi:hypothetical protein
MPYFELKRILEGITYEPQLTLLAQITKDEEEGAFVDRRRFCINDQWYILVDSPRGKTVVGPDYSYIFLKADKFFQRWGKSTEDDPLYSPIGPEVLDIKITSNDEDIPVMDIDTFKLIINKIPKTLTQVAFEIVDIQTNPDFVPMVKYCREIGIEPSFIFIGPDFEGELAEKIIKFSTDLDIIAVNNHVNENTLFSSCINVEGGLLNMDIDVLAVADYIGEVWYSQPVLEHRIKLIEGMSG